MTDITPSRNIVFSSGITLYMISRHYLRKSLEVQFT